MTDAAGSISLVRSYSPFGESTQSLGDFQTDFSFTGEMTDVSGLVYLRARYYDPATGRFVSRDTWEGVNGIPATLSKWNYGFENPILFTDPLGKMSKVPCFMGIFCPGDPIWWYPNDSYESIYEIGSVILCTYLNCTVNIETNRAIANPPSEFIPWILPDVIFPVNICISNVPIQESNKNSSNLWISSEKASQAAKRGWSWDEIKEVFGSPALARSNPEIVNRANNNPVTYYYRTDGYYIVVDDYTSEVIQISNTHDPKWIDEMTNQAIQEIFGEK